MNLSSMKDQQDGQELAHLHCEESLSEESPPLHRPMKRLILSAGDGCATSNLPVVMRQEDQTRLHTEVYVRKMRYNSPELKQRF